VSYKCPVCRYPSMTEPPRDYNICECCGTEFGADDECLGHAQLRRTWILDGMNWFFRSPPFGWDPLTQLKPEDLPKQLRSTNY
jgi:hypothetical protein